jgi:hypothetical protein
VLIGSPGYGITRLPVGNDVAQAEMPCGIRSVIMVSRGHPTQPAETPDQSAPPTSRLGRLLLVWLVGGYGDGVHGPDGAGEPPKGTTPDDSPISNISPVSLAVTSAPFFGPSLP